MNNINTINSSLYPKEVPTSIKRARRSLCQATDSLPLPVTATNTQPAALSSERLSHSNGLTLDDELLAKIYDIFGFPEESSPISSPEPDSSESDSLTSDEDILAETSSPRLLDLSEPVPMEYVDFNQLAENFVTEGHEFLADGELDKAEQSFRTAHAVDPQSIAPLIGLKKVLLEKGIVIE